MVFRDSSFLSLLKKNDGTTLNSHEYVYNSYFTYDGLGRLRKREEYTWQFGSWYAGGTVYYVYDGMRVIQERGSTPLVSYTRGSDLSGSLEGAGGIGGLLARSHGYSSGNWRTHDFYHADGNGNVTYLVNSSQALAAKYRYDPYGNTISSSGGLASANVYRFSSKELHVNSGLYYYGYRFYAPNLQRWLNRDPIDENGGINLYGFVLNGPIATIDPDGRDMFPRIPTIPSFPWPYPFPRPRFPRSFEFPGIQISLPCYSAVKKADSEARAEFDEIKDSYTCMVNGTKKELADFPGAVENTKSSYGVLHCLLGHYANKNGAGTACLVAANYVFEMFMEREWSRKPPGEWYRDTSDDMAEVFTGAKLDAPEDCIPCECKKK